MDGVVQKCSLIPNQTIEQVDAEPMKRELEKGRAERPIFGVPLGGAWEEADPAGATLRRPHTPQAPSPVPGWPLASLLSASLYFSL